jgi:trehalose 6-phosphate synthase
MRLLACSNSGPRLASEGGAVRSSSAAPGGLVPILTALFEEMGGHWVFTALEGFEPKVIRGLSASGKNVSWQPLPIDKRVMERQRASISIGTLLWLFHYLFDTSTAPSFNDEILPAWQDYAEVNQRFANAIVAAHKNDADEVVLVNDFHLMLVPSFFAAKAPERMSRLAYFHHVPWCEPEYFGILPEWIRTDILKSLLTCDVVGFHSERWGEAFLGCCARFLPGLEVSGRTAVYHDHETLVTTAPGPIDADVLEELSDQPATERWREALNRRARGRRIITRVDRLDLWKNLERGFLAYETLLRRRPQLASEFWFCAIVTLPRLQTDQHKRYQARCEQVVARINDRFSASGETVSLLYPDAAGSSRDRAVAALSSGAAVLVNPTFDGLNMVAKEAIVLNRHAPLLLSTNAGVFPQLASVAMPIQPFDIVSTADAIGAATERDHRREEDIAGCVAALHEESAAAWLLAILGGPGRQRNCQSKSGRLRME